MAAIFPLNPDADAALAALAVHREGGQGADDPFLQVGHKAAHVRAAALEVQHDVDHPLAGAVVGELAAAPAPVDREAVGLQQVPGRGRGAGGVERRMLDQPHQFRRRAGVDRPGPQLHGGDRLFVVQQTRLDPPFRRLGTGRGRGRGEGGRHGLSGGLSGR